MLMSELKWFLFGFITAGIGFLIYKSYKKDSDKNAYTNGFVEGFLSGFGAIKSPNAPKEYGEIARSIQQKQAKSYSKINAKYNKDFSQ